MLKSKKAEVVEALAGKFSTNPLLVFTEFKGLHMVDMSDFRNQLRKEGLQFKVIKNTLALLAAKKASLKEMEKLAIGPTAVVFGKGDLVNQARVLTGYLKSSKIPVTIKGGFLEGKPVSPDEITAISQLPRKDILAARLLGQLQSPMLYLLGTLNASFRNLLFVLKMRQQQLEKPQT